MGQGHNGDDTGARRARRVVPPPDLALSRRRRSSHSGVRPLGPPESGSWPGTEASEPSSPSCSALPTRPDITAPMPGGEVTEPSSPSRSALPGRPDLAAPAPDQALLPPPVGALAPVEPQGDITVTALYTAECWRWGGFPDAELLTSRESRTVFNVTNAVMALSRLFRPRFPVLSCSLVQRHFIIDSLLRDGGARQVVEIGAGFSRRGPAFSRDRSLAYVEIDLPHVIAEKRRLLSRTDRGTEVLSRSNYRLYGGDARAIDLATLIDPRRPVDIVVEGVFMHLSVSEQRELWSRAASLCADIPGSRLIFDLVPFVEQPRPGLIGRTLEWLLKRFTRGRTTTQDRRTRADLAWELRAAGFTTIDLHEPENVPTSWELPFLRRHTQALVWECTVEPHTLPE